MLYIVPVKYLIWHLFRLTITIVCLPNFLNYHLAQVIIESLFNETQVFLFGYET